MECEAAVTAFNWFAWYMWIGYVLAMPIVLGLLCKYVSFWMDVFDL